MGNTEVKKCEVQILDPSPFDPTVLLPCIWPTEASVTPTKERVN